MCKTRRQIFISIVLYHNKKDQLLKTINSVLNTKLNIRLYLIDNSSNDNFKQYAKLDKRIIYIYNGKNLGYGKAHNIAIKKSMDENINFHLVLNPDVYFKEGVLENLYNYMIANNDVGQIMPLVLNPNGKIQYTCKLVPTPFDLIVRRFFPKNVFVRYRHKFELRFTNYDKIMEVPYLSGCFMFLRIETLKKVGLFDERFFMYPEDIDLTRRIYLKYKTIFYPNVEIYHYHNKSSYQSFKMFYKHFINIIKYFNKWGWFFDRQRKEINKITLEKLGIK